MGKQFDQRGALTLHKGLAILCRVKYRVRHERLRFRCVVRGRGKSGDFRSKISTVYF